MKRKIADHTFKVFSKYVKFLSSYAVICLYVCLYHIYNNLLILVFISEYQNFFQNDIRIIFIIILKIKTKY